MGIIILGCLVAILLSYFILIGVIALIYSKKDKIRKWIYHKKSIKKGVKNK